jgi:putative membrane protein insertion efficiency factor
MKFQIIFITLFSCGLLFAQINLNDLNSSIISTVLIKEITGDINADIITNTKSIDNFNELSFSYSFVIKSYQRYISSQDRDQCMFQPSCSVFSEQAVRSEGLVKGILLTADRLTRCNGIVSMYYENTNPETHKIIDPVENYK